jgi:hypothetical protein
LPDVDRPVWLPLASDDLDRVHHIGQTIHHELPERFEVLVEKIKLFPNGCPKLVFAGKIVGYAIAHPWSLFSIPVLDQYLVSIPARADCIHIHDVAILPEARGYRSAEHYVTMVRGIAIDLGVEKLACVSVYGTDVLWSRYGFKTETGDHISLQLETYGSSAKYMIADA